MINYCGAGGGMRIGRGNSCTQRKPDLANNLNLTQIKHII
jgi:hypothetical protein